MCLNRHKLFVVDQSEGILEHLDDLTLSRVGTTDNHQSVTDHNGLVELDALLEELSLGLNVHGVTGNSHLRLEEFIVGRRQLNTGEEIGRDTRVKRDIVRSELGQVDVLKGTKADLILRPVECSSEVTTSSENGLEGSHTEIVMILGRELFRGKHQGGTDLDSNRLSILETEGVKLDLSDEGVVWHHHSAGTEQSLEVIRQLGSASVTGVHSDVDGTGAVQDKVGGILEIEGRLLGLDGTLDLENLLSDNGEYFEINSVELIEATPGARGGQSLEELAHRVVIETVRAVEHDTLDGKSFGEILDRLSLTSSSRAFRSTTVIEVLGSHESSVTSIGKCRNDETGRVTKVLESVFNRGSDHLDIEDVVLLDLSPVVTELGSP